MSALCDESIAQMMEVMNMKRVAVKFNQPDQIIDFVRIMNRYEYDVDVKCGSRIVDAKVNRRCAGSGQIQDSGGDCSHR